MTNDTITFDYKFRLPPNNEEVCMTTRDAELYNKYFPALRQFHPDLFITYGVHKVTVTEKLGVVQSIEIEPSRYTFKELITAHKR